MMIKRGLQKMLTRMQKRYDYDVTYLNDIASADTQAALKILAFQSLSSHQASLTNEAIHVVRLRATVHEDCGPCVQLMINMALEAGLDSQTIADVVSGKEESLPPKIRTLVLFTDAVLSHDLAAEDLRQDVIKDWGVQGMVAVAWAISTSRVFPSLKYAMGYGSACHELTVNDVQIHSKKSNH